MGTSLTAGGGRGPMYALITGGSAGIGKALAVECASRGMNILLVALPGDELDAAEKELRDAYGIECRSFGIDLADPRAPERVHAWVSENGFAVNVLINNVGSGSKGAFRTISPEACLRILSLNVLTGSLLTRHFVDDLARHAPSHILNVGSLGGFFNIPEKVIYTASKAYVFEFSRGLWIELKPLGISVSALCPGGTNSNSQTTASNKDVKGLARASILSPERVAKEAVRKMLKGQMRIVPGALNKFYFQLSWILPGFARIALIRRGFRHLKKHAY